MRLIAKAFTHAGVEVSVILCEHCVVTVGGCGGVKCPCADGVIYQNRRDVVWPKCQGKAR